MTSTDFHFHELQNINDPYLLPWLDLYQTAFPQHEQMLISEILDYLQKGSEHYDLKYLAMLDEEAELVGMALFHLDCEVPWLWYIAVRADQRGKGAGQFLYEEIVDRCRSAYPQVKAMVLEVERPDQAESPQDKVFAERRLGFYRRLGVKVATSVRFWLDVGDWQPKTLFYLAIHPFQDLSKEDVSLLLQKHFVDGIESLDNLVLE